MNRKLISIGIFGYGVLVGWAFTADHADQKAKEKEDEVENLKLRLDLLRNQIVVLEKQHDDTDEEDTDEEEPVDEAKTEEIRTNLQSLISQYTSEPDNADAFVNVALDNVMDPTPPFVISKEKYAWDEEEGDQYAKITLTYYPKFRMLLDDDQDLIPDKDIPSMVGWKNLRQFGGESGDPDVVFIRNRRLMTDFEVVKDDENDIPAHVKYGMGREEFETNKAAGIIKLRPEDRA